jgi:hypothetical protein
MDHMRYHLSQQPRQLGPLGEYLDGVEHCLLGILAAPEVFEPLTVIAGGGVERDAIARGREKVARFVALAVDEYLERVERIGFAGRRETSKLLPTIQAVLSASGSSPLPSRGRAAS